MESYAFKIRRSDLTKLEQLCVTGTYMSGHTYLLRDLVAKYSVEFVYYMIRWKADRMDGHHSAADEYFPRMREQVDVLYNRYQELKALPSRSREEEKEFAVLKDKLQEIIYWELKPEGYTHFLDYDQCCEFDVEYGLVKLAYRIDGGMLLLHKYDTRQEKESRMEVPLSAQSKDGHWHLAEFLKVHLSNPANFAGEPVYVHSKQIPL